MYGDPLSVPFNCSDPKLSALDADEIKALHSFLFALLFGTVVCAVFVMVELELKVSRIRINLRGHLHMTSTEEIEG